MAKLEAVARIKLNWWQQAAVVVGSTVASVMKPSAEMVGVLGETTGKYAFQRVRDKMKESPEGRAVLLERPRIIFRDVKHLWDLPPNTFGGAYASYMKARNFSPDDRPPVLCIEKEDDELTYVVMRYREAHDLWHTLFGLNTNLMGEMTLKVIEFQQMQLPMAFLWSAGSLAMLSEKKLKVFNQHYFPWALKAGLQCTDIMSVHYEKYFHEDLEDVRRKWGIVAAPPPPKSQN